MEGYSTFSNGNKKISIPVFDPSLYTALTKQYTSLDSVCTVPATATIDIPKMTSSIVPSTATIDIPKMTSSAVSTATIVIPTMTSNTVPSMATIDIPMMTSSTVSSIGTIDIPTLTSSTVPSVATIDIPTVTSSAVSSAATIVIPTMTSNTVPSKATIDIPKMTSSAVPSMATIGIPTMTSNTVPSMATIDIPLMTPSTVPSMATINIPTVTSSTVPSIATIDIPAMTSSIGSATAIDIVTKTSRTVPSMATIDIPATTSSTVPAMATIDIPAMTSTIGSATATIDIVRKTSSTVPAMATIDIPATTSSTVPAMATIDIPAMTSSIGSATATIDIVTKTSSTVPSMATIDIPAMTSRKVPSMATIDIPATTSSTVPATAAIDIPTMTSMTVPDLMNTQTSITALKNTPNLTKNLKESTVTISKDITVENLSVSRNTNKNVSHLKAKEITKKAFDKLSVDSVSNADSKIEVLRTATADVMSNLANKKNPESNVSVMTTDVITSLENSNVIHVSSTELAAPVISAITSVHNSRSSNCVETSPSFTTDPNVKSQICGGTLATSSAILSKPLTYHTNSSWREYISNMRVPRMRFHPYSHDQVSATRGHSLDSIGAPCPVHGIRKKVKKEDRAVPSPCNTRTESTFTSSFPQAGQPASTKSIKLLQKQLGETISIGNLKEKYARILCSSQQLLSNLTRQPSARSVDNNHGGYLKQDSTGTGLPCFQYGGNLEYVCTDSNAVHSPKSSLASNTEHGMDLRSKGILYQGLSLAPYTQELRKDQGNSPISISSLTYPPIQQDVFLHRHSHEQLQGISSHEKREHDLSFQTNIPASSRSYPNIQQEVSNSQMESSPTRQIYSSSYSEVMARQSSLEIGRSTNESSDWHILITQNREGNIHIHPPNNVPFEVKGTPVQIQEAGSQMRQPSTIVHTNDDTTTTTTVRCPQDQTWADVPRAKELQSHLEPEGMSENIAQNSPSRNRVSQSLKRKLDQDSNAIYTSAAQDVFSRRIHDQSVVGLFSPAQHQQEKQAPIPVMSAFHVPLQGCSLPLPQHLPMQPGYVGASQSGTFGFGPHTAGYHDGAIQMQSSKFLHGVHPYQQVTYLSQPVLPPQPFLAHDVCVAPSITTQGQSIYPNMARPALQPTVNTYPSPYLMFRSANLVFPASNTHDKEPEISQHNTSPQITQAEQGLEKGSKKVSEMTQYVDEVDEENKSLPPFPELGSAPTSTVSQRYKRQKVFTKSNLERNTTQKKCEDKLHKCSICGKCYSRAFTLKTHYRVHTGEKPYKCPFCKKQFTQSGGLDSHLRTHTGEKPYQCGICQREFSHSAAVKNHLRTHTGAKPFVCDLGCGKSFADCSTLTKHRRVHTGEKPFECKECGAKFTQAGNMNKHMKKIHRSEGSSHKKNRC